MNEIWLLLIGIYFGSWYLASDFVWAQLDLFKLEDPEFQTGWHHVALIAMPFLNTLTALCAVCYSFQAWVQIWLANLPTSVHTNLVAKSGLNQTTPTLKSTGTGSGFQSVGPKT